MVQTAVFGGGCFWCTEAVFRMIRGVVDVFPGYAGGDVVDPTYEEVSSGTTGHAEVIRVEYDPSIISYADLLVLFFASHDPTTLNRQGNDVGTQYRSIIFYTSKEQEDTARKYVAELSQDPVYVDKPIVTKIEELTDFYEAEDYHKNYYATNTTAPYCQIVIAPKVEKVRKRYQELLAQ
jgi:peptide-methionine (S)-S-oxide reductase